MTMITSWERIEPDGFPVASRLSFAILATALAEIRGSVNEGIFRNVPKASPIETLDIIVSQFHLLE